MVCLSHQSIRKLLPFQESEGIPLKKDILVQQLVNSFGNWVRTDCENRAGGTARMTRDLYPYTSLFSPIQINKLTVKNRLVMAPMGNCQMAEETGRPNDKMLQYFFARAEGGVGLLTTGLIPISHHIDSSVTEKGNYSYFPRIDGTRTNFMGWRDLAQGVHARGSRIFIQLTPGLGRVGNPQCLLTKLQLPVSASWNPNFYLPDVPCRPLTDLECDKIIRNAAQASMDAKVMGMDGVYLHGHEGYLLDQLTSPAFNHRKIGKYADWQRFGVDMIKAIRRKVGPNYPIMYRIDLSLALNETYGDRMDTVKSLKGFKNGRSIADTLNYMENLVKAGVDMFDVDLGCYDNWWLPHPPAGMPAGCFLDVSKVAKEYFAARGVKSNVGMEVPIVAVGKLGYPDLAEQALRDGKCDMIMLGRPVLAVPGSIYSALSEGTNELLRTHRAEPLCRAADALEILGIGAQTAAPEQQRFDPAAVSPDAQQVYAALKPTPQGIDALCAATRLPAGRVLAACTELELMGGAQVQPGRRYIAL